MTRTESLTTPAFVLGLALGLSVGLLVAPGSGRSAPSETAGTTTSAAEPGSSSDRGRFESPAGTVLDLLLSSSNLGGGELQIGEITFPPGTNSGDHQHGATEVFYVLEGELEHVVGGVSQILRPGDIGFVRPPARVNHIVAEGGPPARVLVIWAPGGEGTRIVENWRPLPSE